MIKVRCKNYGNCPLEIDDGSLHECESIDELGCSLRQSGGDCGVEEQSDSGIGDRLKAAFGGLVESPVARLALIGILGLSVIGGAGFGAYKLFIAGPECEIADAKQLLALDPKVGELEKFGAACLEAGMAQANADKIVTGTVMLRGALDRKSPIAGWHLGRLFDPLKRPELEEQSEVPTLLPAADAREALRFYDLAGKNHEEAAVAAAALRAKYPELGASASGKGGGPLPMPGHSGLLQRVLTKPGAELFAKPGGSGAGRPVAPFSLYYVFETKNGWLRVGERLGGSAKGWISRQAAQDWNVMLVMRYAPPDNRQPALFFRDELAAKSLLTRPGASEVISELLESAKGADPDPRLVAVEDQTVDWSASPYLMPILKTAPVVTDSGRKVFLTQVAAVTGSGGTQVGSNNRVPGGGFCRGGSPETALHQIVFVIDTTTSMGPYINGVKRIANHWAKEVERRGISEKFRFGVVAYRNNMDSEPQRSGLEYVTKTVLPLSRTSDANAFATAMRDIGPASVSTHSFDEDAVAGMNDALRLNWSQGCGVRMVFLVTDAGSLTSDDPRARFAGKGLTTLSATAKEQGIDIFPVHVLTPEARAAGNTDKAAIQYKSQILDASGASLYRSIRDGSTKAFSSYLDDVGKILDGIEDETKGKLIDRARLASISGGDSGAEQSVERLVLGKLFNVQQRFLGAASNAQVPTFTASWTSDRDLSNPDVAAFDIRIFLTRRQLGQLAEKCQSLVANAKQARTESGRFFDLLRMVSAATAQDPSRFANGATDLSGLMPSFLALLPYKSDVLSLTPQEWRGMGATKQDAFVRRLNEKVAFYRELEANQSKWLQLTGADANEQVALVPLSEMP